ncbi:MAG: tetratricopeptide repeat protein [Acidobacteriota bacterium]
MTRLSRKEIVKEDQIHAGINRGTTWMLGNARALSIVAAIILVAGVGVFFWRSHRASADSRAQGLFGEALQSFHGQVPSAAQPPQQPPQQPNSLTRTFKSDEEKNQDALKKFAQVASDYPSTQVGRLARYYAALCKQRLNRNDEAVSDLKKVVDESDDREARNLARNALATLYRQKQQYQQSADLYKAILGDSDTRFPDAAVLMALGETYEEMGNRKEALQYYQRIAREFADSSYRPEADSRIAALGQVPAVAKP